MPTKASERWIADGENMAKQFQRAGYATDLQYGDDKVENQIAQIGPTARCCCPTTRVTDIAMRQRSGNRAGASSRQEIDVGGAPNRPFSLTKP
ncbi:hypothetical protein [Streptomyces sp. NBC_01077]|uniref:hypothetical protein n=1 Tax=Streptomyces sp. NBC_01077 TaxID=2903746 RepID=UPI00386A947B